MQLSIISFGIAFVSLVSAQSEWANYPSLPTFVLHNGFVDKLYDLVSKCVQDCLVENKNVVLRCPDADIGCRCVLAKYNDPWAKCVANKCHGGEVTDAENAVKDVCKAAGVTTTHAAHFWNVDAAIRGNFDDAKSRTSPLITA